MKKGRKHSPETIEKIRVSKLGSKNPMWKGDEATKDSGRRRAKRRYNPPEGYEIHHIDGNPFNNNPSNIQFLTRKQHMREDGRMEALIKRNKESWTPERKEKISGENHPNWKGDNASNNAKYMREYYRRKRVIIFGERK